MILTELLTELLMDARGGQTRVSKGGLAVPGNCACGAFCWVRSLWSLTLGWVSGDWLELREDHDGADGQGVDEHNGGGRAQKAGDPPEDAEQEAVERELGVHQDLGNAVRGCVRQAELRLVRQHGEGGDEAQAEEAAGAEQGSDFGVADGEVRGDDAGQDERPDDAPSEGVSAAALFAGGASLTGECFCW